MTISQGLVKVVFGSKEMGANGYKWYRITRRDLDSLASSLSRLPNFYYAKVYRYERHRRNQGQAKEQLAYIYWDKDGFLTTKLS